MLVAAGCQGGDTIGGLKLPGTGGGQQQAIDDRITVEELLAFCPAIAVRDGGTVHDSYPRGVRDDASKLAYRATISESTRACTTANGVMNINVAVAGRVIPGASGTTGTVRLPILVTVISGTETIYSQSRMHEVAVADTAGATQFLFSEPNISIPAPQSRNVRVYVGFENSKPR